MSHPLRGCRAHYRRILLRPQPLRAFRRLYGERPYGFLYESLEEHGTHGRYSFLGGDPAAVLTGHENGCVVERNGERDEDPRSPLELIRSWVREPGYALPLTSFGGGAVGYLGYDTVRRFAPLPDPPPQDLAVAEACFMMPREVIVLDHRDEVAHLIRYDDDEAAALRRLDALESELTSMPIVEESSEEPDRPLDSEQRLRSNIGREAFMESVRRAKQHILDGDLLQVVLSQRFEFEARVRPVDYYRALRRTNPSPYMYYLQLDGMQIAGSSPEVLVKQSGRRVVTRPLAGTRPRGETEEQDRALAEELLSDPKERAEHLMLIDLARNDLGRISRVGSIEIEAYFEIERYRRVMHLVSQVSGKLRPEYDAVDVFEASFPAGTVSGAPKVRAMQIIDQLEPVRRGSYAGAIGYFGFTGDMDLCIAIRTMMFLDGKGYLQAGAGVVADSDPEKEYDETVNKARGVARAIALAEAEAVPR